MILYDLVLHDFDLILHDLPDFIQCGMILYAFYLVIRDFIWFSMILYGSTWFHLIVYDFVYDFQKMYMIPYCDVIFKMMCDCVWFQTRLYDSHDLTLHDFEIIWHDLPDVIHRDMIVCDVIRLYVVSYDFVVLFKCGCNISWYDSAIALNKQVDYQSY